MSLVTLALGLGIMHALDADHVMAVSGLASTRASSRKDSMWFCLRWAVGHGVSLLTIGSCVYLLGMAIPDQLSHYAEHAVGVVLVIIGLLIVYDLLRKNAHLHFHQHDGLPEHAHWHTHGKSTVHHRDRHRHQHGAVMVGILHGTAGSAPLLVLVPLAKLNSAYYGIAYLIAFSLGVLLAMLLFGGLIGSLYRWLSRWGTRSVTLLRSIIATSSITFGAYLLLGA